MITYELNNLNDECLELAGKLDERHLLFANMILTKNEHGLTDSDCYHSAGYPRSDKKNQVPSTACRRLLVRQDVCDYLRAMKRAAAERIGLKVARIDEHINNLIETSISDVVVTEEQTFIDAHDNVHKRYVHTLKCNLQDLPREVAQCIQEIKRNSAGDLIIKMYNRLDAVRLGAQRLGILTDKRELTGPNGTPIETKLINSIGFKKALVEAREGMFEQDDC